MTHADIERWFASRGWTVFDFQRECWAAYAAGESGLIHAPTGAGKTLAAFLGPLLDPRPGASLKVLWITPMRALAADTAQGLQRACEELGSPWTVALRTGDTSSGARARQRKHLPDTLVTTPESLSLMLSYADLLPHWSGVQAVIVDEWHELLGTKRGVQTELCLSRLRALAPGLRVWGLSATLGNLQQAAQVLLGPNRSPRLIAGSLPRETLIETLIPEAVERFPWGGHLGLRLVPRVIEAIEAAATTLVFTNTRAQAERWFEALSSARPELALALHHGSLDSELRLAVEEGLKSGRLRAVVATSSLDLGVDFAPVDQVIQIGGPKGIARLLQRAGRSGHRPGAKSRILCVPTHALELAEFAAAREAAEAQRIEARRPLLGCLDVLAQHLVTLALTHSLSADEFRAEVLQTHAYATLSDSDWHWVLDFVMRGGSALAAYPEFRRVVEREGRLAVDDLTLARRHRMAVGTITSDQMMRVAWVTGGNLGRVEESFISRLKPGDSFLFAGRKLTLVRVKDMTAQVRPGVRPGGGSNLIPRWQGGKMPLSSELATALLRLFAHGSNSPEVQALAPWLELQKRWSHLPRPGLLLVERSRSREGEHLFVFPFAGRPVHEGLSALLAYRLAKLTPLTCSFSVNDYGFELMTQKLPELNSASLLALLTPTGLESDLPGSLNASEMARRRFREIARVAGLVFEGYPGSAKSAKQVQASSGLLFDVLERYDPGNRLTAQAMSEALEQLLDYPRLCTTLEQLASSEVVLVDSERFTPLAFPLWAERISHQLSSEDLKSRVERMVQQLEAAAQPAQAKSTARSAG